MKLIFVLVDALKSLYLSEENMPFLYSLSHNGKYVKKIYASPGFCERSEVFSGLDPYDSGYFTAVGYNPLLSEYSNHKLILNILSFSSRASDKISRRVLRKYTQFQNISLKPYLIPLKKLPLFSLTEDGNVKFISHRNLFDVLDENNKTYTTKYFTSLADRGPRFTGNLLDNVLFDTKNNVDFIPIYIGEIDATGHKFGDDIESIKPELRKVDSLLSSLFDISKVNGYSFSVLGDHGMVPVVTYFDLVNLLKEAGFKPNLDFDLFLDSTIARFWVKDISLLSSLQIFLESLSEFGFVIDSSNYADYRIPLDVHNREGNPLYGNLCFCVEPGVLISPDYFHGREERVKGMHGYLKNDSEHSTGLYVSWSPLVDNVCIPSLHLCEVCNELAHTLCIPEPNLNFTRGIIV